MRLLGRYLAWQSLRAAVLVALSLLSIFALLQLVDQVDEVGQGSYGMLDALLHVLLLMPRQLLDLAPVMALLGGIAALGALASGRELMAMQAAGVSQFGITRVLLRLACAMVLGLLVVEEFIAPPMQQFALQRQAQALAGQDKPGLVQFIDLNNLLYGVVPASVDITGQGFWAREAEQFLHIEGFDRAGRPHGITLLEFDGFGLQRMARARKAELQAQHWQLYEVLLKERDANNHWMTRPLPQWSWAGFLDREQLRQVEKISLVELPPNSLSPLALYRYSLALRAAGKDAMRYELALWQKLMLPANTLLMLALAVPFAFGSLRSAAFGLRLALGIGLAVTFYLGNQILASLGQLWGLSAALTSLLPPLLLLILLTLWYRRLHV